MHFSKQNCVIYKLVYSWGLQLFTHLHGDTSPHESVCA